MSLQLLHVKDTGQRLWANNVLLGDDIYYCLCNYIDKDIPKAAGFRWHPDKKVWWTANKTAAGKLLEFSSDPLSDWHKELQALRTTREKHMNGPVITECPYCKSGELPKMEHRRWKNGT